jgi:hypothetical protein
MFKRNLHQTFAGVLRSNRGGIAIWMGFVLVFGVVPFALLATEVGFVLFKQREMQQAADGAAYSGALALSAGQNARSEARAVAASNKPHPFIHGTDNVTVTVNVPPTLEPYSQDQGVEVIISQPWELAISRLSGREYVIGARAIATLQAGGQVCVLALKGTNYAQAVKASGGAVADLQGCSLAVNSISSSSLDVSGGARITASAVSTAGGYSTSGGGKIELTATGAVKTGQRPVKDPYASLAMPTQSCTRTTLLKVTSSTTLPPGGYCGGISVSGGATLTLLSDHVYNIRDGLSVSGNSQLIGNHVTLVMEGDATVSFSGGSIINLVAPTTGPTAGIAFFGDRNASGESSFTGGTNQTIVGAIYLPGQSVKYTGGVGLNPTKCTELIASTITFAGNSSFRLGCSGMPIQTVGNQIALVH